MKNRYFKNSIKIVDDDEFDSFFPLVSIVILTANKIECDSLNYIANQKSQGNIKRRKHFLQIFDSGDECSPDAYIFRLKSSYILHLNASETGSNTPGGSTDLVRYISKCPTLKPNCIISYGICYGRDPEHQEIGDVLIPKKIYPWSIGQKINDKKFTIKHDNFNLNLEHELSSSRFYSLLKDYTNDEDGSTIEDSVELNATINKELKKFLIKNTLGNMSSGEAVVSSKEVKKMLRNATNNEKEIGGEMEGYGMAKECIFYANIPCLLIKAICDWGEHKNIDKILCENGIECPEYLKDKLQAYAAFCAALSLFKLINLDNEHFLQVPVLIWMDDAKRKDKRCGEENYAPKTSIIKTIGQFFNVTPNIANNIFATMIKSKILEPSHNDPNLYHVKENKYTAR